MIIFRKCQNLSLFISKSHITNYFMMSYLKNQLQNSTEKPKIWSKIEVWHKTQKSKTRFYFLTNRWWDKRRTSWKLFGIMSFSSQVALDSESFMVSDKFLDAVDAIKNQTISRNEQSDSDIDILFLNRNTVRNWKISSDRGAEHIRARLFLDGTVQYRIFGSSCFGQQWCQRKNKLNRIRMRFLQHWQIKTT